MAIIKGNDAANNLSGTSGNDSIFGYGANDILKGLAGNDTMTGGLGNDTYYVDSPGDRVVESAGAGTDWVFSSVTHTLATNVEKLTLLGSTNMNGTGNTLNNTLTGNTGNNILNGLGGSDTMSGGAGNDTYYVDSTGDRVVEGVGAGTDWVFSSVAHTLATNVEKLTLLNSTNLNGTGNTLNNTLTGNAGNNILTGLAGNDTLSGGAGNDQLIGGVGNDSLVGGAGSDTYRLDATSDRDVAVVDRSDRILISTPTASSSFSVNLTGNNLVIALDGTGAYDYLTEQLTLQNWMVKVGGVYANRAGTIQFGDGRIFKVEGSGGTGDDVISIGATDGNHYWLEGYGGNDSLTGGAGNDLLSDIGGGNDTLNGGAGGDVLFAGGGADYLLGGVGNDKLVGGNGDDRLLGGAGTDMYVFNGESDDGWCGNDTILSDVNNASDILMFPNARPPMDAQRVGNDLQIQFYNGELETVQTLKLQDYFRGGGYAIGTLSFSMTPAHSDELVTFTTALKVGSTGNDKLNYSAGTYDVFAFGLTGNDSIIGSNGNNVLYGGVGNDTLVGGAKNDMIIGGAGNDSMSGGVSGEEQFIFFGTWGKDFIVNNGGSSANDSCWLPELSTANVTIGFNGNDLVLTAGANTITLDDWKSTADSERLNAFQLQDEWYRIQQNGTSFNWQSLNNG